MPGRTRRALYRSFRLVHALESWIERRFTTAGRLALGGLAASAVIGVDTNRTVAYQAFAFLAVLVVVAMAASPLFRGRFAVRRTLPRFGTAGEPLAYRVVVENLTGRRQPDLLLVEELADPRPSLEEFVRAREPGEERRNWFDRKVGYPRWVWLLRSNRRAEIQEQPLPPLPPRGRAELRPLIVPARRGRLSFRSLTVARPDPFGLFKAQVTVPAPASLLVLPRRYPLPRVPLPGARRYQQGGVALAASVGDSEEFASLRDYRPGDPLRRVHWKSWARLGKPIVKEYQDEFFVRHALVLDTFSSAEGSPHFEEAVSVAASFACAVESQESLLDLMFVGPEAYVLTAGRGLGHTEQMLEMLAGVRSCTAHPFGALHHLVLERHASLTGVICVLLAWDRQRQALVRDLEARGMPTLVLVVHDDASGQAPDAEPGVETTGGVHHLHPGRIAEGLARL